MQKKSIFRRLKQNQQGVAAIEFALILPLLMTLSLGGFELSRLLLVNQKVDRIAYTVSDVVTQSTSLTRAQLDVIFTVAGQIMEPFTFDSNALIIVNSVYKQDETSPKVRWRYSGGGTLARMSKIGALNQAAQLPIGFDLNERENIIISEIFYRYEPLFSFGVIEARDIYRTVIFKPRLGALTTNPT